MTPQELKSSILQLAIQGKLVEQRPEEGTAEELYQQIQAEKQKLIKEKKIKKSKPLPEITEEEIPFEIPQNWVWIRLRDICTKIVDGDHNPPAGEKTPTDYWMLSAQNINNDHLSNLDQVRYLSKDIFSRVNERTNLQKGDVLLTIVGTLGRSCVYEYDYNICFQRSVSVLATLIYNYYLKFVLDSGYIQKFMFANATGTAQKGFYLNQVERLLIPVPPLAEQKRIVAKIEELLPYINRYEKAWSKLEDFNKRFPVDMQKSVLQIAIQGKLVEQRQEEGTGEELYQQIQAEKQKLIKEKKIKKSKPLPEISEEEIPFDIPESWKWVRLKEITTKITDGTHHSPPNYENGEYMYITAKNIKDQGVMLSNITYVSKNIHDEIFARCNPELGDVLLIKDGATTGVVTVNTLDEPFSLLSSVALLKMPENMCAWYLVYVLRSDLFYKSVRAQMKGTGITRITLKQIEPMVVPLPPLAEQKRIVAKLEEILPLCERLKKKEGK